MSERIFVGIDGGASKTAGILCDADGVVLARSQLPGCIIGPNCSCETGAVLSQVLDELCSLSGIAKDRIARCGMGLNGVDFSEHLEAQLEDVARHTGLSRDVIVLVNDGIAALWGSTAAASAAVFQHGSGITSAYRRRHGEEVLFDYLNAGHHFDLRSQLIHLVARMIDGRAEATALKDIALRHFGVDDAQQFAELLYRDRIAHGRLRNTCPLIFQSWLEGDTGAAALVEGALSDYAASACAMLARIGQGPAHVSFGGGVLRSAPERFWRRLSELIRGQYPEAMVKRPDMPPQHGAAVMASFRAGLDPRDLFNRLLKREANANQEKEA